MSPYLPSLQYLTSEVQPFFPCVHLQNLTLRPCFWYWKKYITYEVSTILSRKREKSRFPVKQKVFDAKKKKKKGWIYWKFEKPISISFEYTSFTVKGFGSTKNHGISKFESVWMWSWRSLGDKNKYNKNRATLNIFLSINVIAMFLKELFCY